MALTIESNVAVVPVQPLAPESASATQATKPESNILDPGFNLTLRPMRYPQFFEMIKTLSKILGLLKKSTFLTT